MVGIMIMPTFTSKVPYYYIALALAVLSVLSIQAIVNSKPGYYFVSIREDQDAAESLGDQHDTCTRTSPWRSPPSGPGWRAPCT